jgi:hypothetical protein
VADLQIKELFLRPIDRPIEEVTKVDQNQEDIVRGELAEYVVTDSLRKHYRTVLESYRSAADNPTERVGVWVSGFFGSGKSSFAKILGYVLEPRMVVGESAAELFADRAEDDAVRALLSIIVQRMPGFSVILDLSTDRDIRSNAEGVAQVMYRALLRALGYARDLDLAHLEMDLEDIGKFDEFRQRYAAAFGTSWEQDRDLVIRAFPRASQVMHQMEPETYRDDNAWLQTRKPVPVTINDFADRVLPLVRRRRGDCFVVFVVDEVGQYVSSSTDRMLELQGMAEALGRAGRGRLWLVVTSQKKLDEVVDDLTGRQVELARLIDRFQIRVDLLPSDISEVAAKRVLAKRAAGEQLLKELYDRHRGTLETHTKLQGGVRRPAPLDRDSFIRLYPFLPYQIDLIIDAVSGLRSRSASRFTGGSNRTVIKLAQQMVIHPAVNLGVRPIGHLVTLDMVYDLNRADIPQERALDVAAVEKNFGEDSLEARIAKVLCLLEPVSWMRRSKENVAAVLYPALGSAPLILEVERSLERLREARFVREAEDGWKLQTELEKGWDQERRDISPRPRDLEELRDKALEQILGELPGWRWDSYPGGEFRAEVRLGEKRLGREGDLLLHLTLVEDERLGDEEAKLRRRSREEPQAAFWLAPEPEQATSLCREVFRSARMVEMHERGHQAGAESLLVREEGRRREQRERQLRTELTTALLQRGRVLFQGRQVELRGKEPGEAVRGLLEQAVPQIFDRFPQGAAEVGPKEAVKLLESHNLQGLPAALTEEGLKLVATQEGRRAVDPEAPAARAVRDVVERLHGTGAAAEGHKLVAYFQRAPYRWHPDVVLVVTAALFRARHVELLWQGKRFRDPAEAREVFQGQRNFRQAVFTLRESLGIEHRRRAARFYQELTGKEISLEEVPLATQLRRWLGEQRQRLAPLAAAARVEGLPGSEQLGELEQVIEGLLSGGDEDLVQSIADQGEELTARLRRLPAVEVALQPANQALVRRCRRLLEVWPEYLRQAGEAAQAVESGRLVQEILAGESLFERLADLTTAERAASKAYADFYATRHAAREKAFAGLVQELANLPGWTELPAPAREQLTDPLRRRSCAAQEMDGTCCKACRASLAQMESDLAAAPYLGEKAKEGLLQLLRPAQTVERLQAARYFGSSVETPEELEAGIQGLREDCEKLLAQGARVIIQ